MVGWNLHVQGLLPESLGMRNHGVPYRWDDLDGERPTREEYEAQEGVENA